MKTNADAPKVDKNCNFAFEFLHNWFQNVKICTKSDRCHVQMVVAKFGKFTKFANLMCNYKVDKVDSNITPAEKFITNLRFLRTPKYCRINDKKNI